MTTLEMAKESYQQFLAGRITLGDFLAVLNRFLDLTEEEPEVEPPPPPPPPLADEMVAKTVKKEHKS